MISKSSCLLLIVLSFQVSDYDSWPMSFNIYPFAIITFLSICAVTVLLGGTASVQLSTAWASSLARPRYSLYPIPSQLLWSLLALCYLSILQSLCQRL